MSAPIIQGWCPGALRPMRSGDGWVVRVRPSGGRLSQAQAAGIAAMAAQHGNGLIDLSARANVQLRGVTPETHAPLINGLAALGLLDADPDRESRRNIVVTPFWTGDDAAPRIAAALAAALAAPDAPQTPGKFGYAVDTGPVPVLRAVSADIRIERGADGLICRADGCDRGVPVTEGDAPAAALALARWFLDAGGAPEGRGRMAAWLARVPLPARFATVPMLKPCGDAKAGTGIDSQTRPVLQKQNPAIFPSRRIQDSARPSGASGNTQVQASLLVTVPVPALWAREAPGPGPTPAGFLVGFAFGQMQADTLAALAALGPLRVTPWRMLLIEGLATAPDLVGVVTRADDPLRRVTACTGAPGCLQAHAATRDLARALAPYVRAPLHVSGCAKGCAHPGPAALTLTATPAGFDLIRGGTAADPPVQTGLSAEALIATPSILNGPP